jgi:hypothetical protein
MTTLHVARRRTAILTNDKRGVGLMEADEEGTIARLRR